MSSLCENAGSENNLVEEFIPKKVRFRDKDDNTHSDVMIDLSINQPTFWKDKLVGHSSKSVYKELDEKEDFDILEGNSEILCEWSSFYLFLGQNLSNPHLGLWKPSTPLHMMDIENGYFLVKFQNKLDCEKALSEGPWTIFGQYLTVQPWTMAFDPSQAYLNVVMAWIKFPGLPGYLYNHKILAEIGEMVRKVVKLDMNIDSRMGGCFAQLAVYVNLERPLVSQILINGCPQRVEYESLQTICFHCERYGHVKNNCSFRSARINVEKETASPEMIPENHNLVEDGKVEKDENYRPWMTVERRPRQKFRDNVQHSYGN
ncbi:hypothetical protein Gohar_022182 [Gossypium harknessii]|uniref:CCHC-type domain-containing protein n=1 Tax=Gossypium harknessii TaxID=34285 RepID=A0A7J9IBT9_9ROSI|nr:hypothetical protein [Gossypium harknessii]